MNKKSIDIAGGAIAWLAALTATTFAISALWLSRHQPIEMDLAMMHYSAFLINEKHFLLYRDIFENNLPGPFFFHALIGKVFGYGAHPIRILDAGVLFSLAWLSWLLLSPVSRVSAVFAPALFTLLYFSGGTTAAFQRDYVAIVPIAAALTLLCRARLKPTHNAAMVGALCGLACGFKPNFIVVAPALYLILLLDMQGTTIKKIQQTILPATTAFIALFSIPIIWGIQHADFRELLALYKTYTPIYVSTRPDLYHYDSHSQQLLDLAFNQSRHLLNMTILAAPGILWAWYQHRDNSTARKHLRNLSILTFAIAWHELIAGKYWFAHLLAPYFFVILCFSLLLTPVNYPAKPYGKLIRILISIFLLIITGAAGFFVTNQLKNKHYDAKNHDIRSQKIARYLQANLSADDKVQSLDGSGDGQGALLLAQATTATRFVEDIPLYLQPDAPATKAFREEFLASMREKPPEFFVYIHNFFHPAGGNRLKEFKELNDFIHQNYEEAETEDNEYTIYKHKK